MQKRQTLRLTVCSARLEPARCYYVEAQLAEGGVVASTRPVRQATSQPFWNQTLLLPLLTNGQEEEEEEEVVELRIRSKQQRDPAAFCRVPVPRVMNELADVWIELGASHECCHVCMKVVEDGGGEVASPAVSLRSTTTSAASSSATTTAARALAGKSRQRKNANDEADSLVLVDVIARLDEVRKLVYLLGGEAEGAASADQRRIDLEYCLADLQDIEHQVLTSLGSQHAAHDKLLEAAREYRRDCEQLMEFVAPPPANATTATTNTNEEEDDDDGEEEEEEEWKPHFISSLAAFDRLMDFGYVIEYPPVAASTLEGDWRGMRVYSYEAPLMRAYRVEYSEKEEDFPPLLQEALRELVPAAPFAVITIAASPQHGFGTREGEIMVVEVRGRDV